MNEINKVYFNLIIEQDTFRIIESDKKVDALPVLNRIEEVVAKGLRYDPKSTDVYSKLSHVDLLSLLKSKASEIVEGDLSKDSKLKALVKKIFNKDKQVLSAHQSIVNLFPYFDMLPNELVQQVVCQLPSRDLPNVALLNLHGKSHSDRALILRAHEFGYRGEELSGATTYLKKLFQQVEDFCDKELIPEKYISKKHLLIHPEETLQNLKNLTYDDLFKMLLYSDDIINQDLYSESFAHLRTALLHFAKDLPLKGVNPNIQSDKGETILHHGVRKEQKDVVEFFLKIKADPNSIDFLGFTPLCINTSNPIITKLLLEHGAEIDNQTNPDGNTALHFASKHGQIETLGVLLECGAKTNIQNGQGKTALYLAVAQERINTVAALLENGADPNVLTNDQWSPLDLAQQQGFISILSILLEYGGDFGHID